MCVEQVLGTGSARGAGVGRAVEREMGSGESGAGWGCSEALRPEEGWVSAWGQCKPRSSDR